MSFYTRIVINYTIALLFCCALLDAARPRQRCAATLAQIKIFKKSKKGRKQLKQQVASYLENLKQLNEYVEEYFERLERMTTLREIVKELNISGARCTSRIHETLQEEQKHN